MAGFQLKDFVSIAAAQINHAKASQDRLTDFEVGSVARTLLESSAVEIEELYQKIFAGILDAIPTAIYKAFDFELIPASAARGNVTVTFGVPIVNAFTIPAGTVFSAPSKSLKFVSAVDVVVPTGSVSAMVLVQCATPGSVGNIDVGAITGAVAYTFPLGSVITNVPFTSGNDGQSEAERKARFVEFILSLSRGTVVSIRYAVRQSRITSSSGVLLEYVSRVGIQEVPGQVDVYLYGSSGAPSAALLAAAQTMIDGTPDAPGYRALGVEVRVRPMVERAVPVTLKVKLLPGLTQTQSIIDAIATLLATEFEAVDSGGVLYVENLTNAALTVSGVQQVLAENDTNVACAANEVLTLGAFSVEWLANA